MKNKEQADKLFNFKPIIDGCTAVQVFKLPFRRCAMVQVYAGGYRVSPFTNNKYYCRSRLYAYEWLYLLYKARRLARMVI